MTRDDPATEYKRLLDTAHQAARAHDEHERLRGKDLSEQVREASKAITDAAARESTVAKEIAAWWSKETDSLTGIDWLHLSKPEPDLDADPRKLNSHLRDIEPATAAFRAALRRALWPRKVP